MTKRKIKSERPAKKLKTILETDPFDPSVDYSVADTLKALVKVAPDDARVCFEYALLTNSFKHFQKAVNLCPTNAEFHHGFAKFIHRFGASCACHDSITSQSRNPSKESAKIHFEIAVKNDPNNAEFLYATTPFYRHWSLSDKTKLTSVLRGVLKLDENHPAANERLASLIGPTRWHNIWTPSYLEARDCALKALRGALAITKQAKMHDIIAIVAEHEGNYKTARHHYETALLLEPLEEPRNYWKFLQKHTQEKELLSVVCKFKKSFSVKKDVSIAAFFDRYAILTPGYRALLEKNNPTAITLMQQYALREKQWILLIPPFDDERFPQAITETIMDFLFHL